MTSEDGDSFASLENDLLDIINGWCELRDSKGNIFVYKHISIKEGLGLNKIYQRRLSSAIKSGVLTRDELLEEAEKAGHWSKEDEEFISSNEWQIDRLKEAKKKVSDASQKKSIDDNIRDKERLIGERKGKRDSLLNHSAETLAEYEKLRAILDRCYTDSSFSKKIPADQSSILAYLNKINEEKRLVQIAFMEEFFELFILNKKNPFVLFENKGFNITSYQKNLLVIAGILSNKLEFFGDKMDKKKKSDPYYIYTFEESNKNTPDNPNSTVSDHNDLRMKARSGKNLTPEDLLD